MLVSKFKWSTLHELTCRFAKMTSVNLFIYGYFTRILLRETNCF